MKVIEETLVNVADKIDLNKICNSCEFRNCCKEASKCEYMMFAKELD